MICTGLKESLKTCLNIFEQCFKWKKKGFASTFSVRGEGGGELLLTDRQYLFELSFFIRKKTTYNTFLAMAFQTRQLKINCPQSQPICNCLVPCPVLKNSWRSPSDNPKVHVHANHLSTECSLLDFLMFYLT